MFNYKLSSFFTKLRTSETKNNLLNCSNGESFESAIITTLVSNGFNRFSLHADDDDTILVKKHLKKIKPTIQNQLHNEILDNDLYLEMPHQFFVYQPYGKQNYPDFLVFTDKKIFEVETKFSAKKQKKPMWNGKLPKKFGIYIFAGYGSKDLTFFMGKDMLSDEMRKTLFDFYFNKIKVLENEIRDFQEMNNTSEVLNEELFNKGFTIYVRKTFSQSKKLASNSSLNLFEQPDKDTQEENVIELIQDIENPTP